MDTENYRICKGLLPNIIKRQAKESLFYIMQDLIGYDIREPDRKDGSIQQNKALASVSLGKGLIYCAFNLQRCFCTSVNL